LVARESPAPKGVARLRKQKLFSSFFNKNKYTNVRHQRNYRKRETARHGGSGARYVFLQSVKFLRLISATELSTIFITTIRTNFLSGISSPTVIQQRLFVCF
jgi:hypothetical protein